MGMDLSGKGGCFRFSQGTWRAVLGLEAVREGSNTGKSPQHQATHHRMDHGLATLAQPLVVLAHPSALRELADGSLCYPAPR